MAIKLAGLGKIRQLQDRVTFQPDVLPFHHIGFTLSLCRKWPDSISAIIDEPTWRHYSLGIITFGWDHNRIDRHPSRRIEDYTRHLGMVDLVWGA